MIGGAMNQANPIDQEVLERIIKEVFEKIEGSGQSGASPGTGKAPESGVSFNPKRIPVGISVRHLHICKEDLETLFGKDADLHPDRELYQPGEFAAKETVALIGPKMRLLERVRILGPMRDRTQVELAKTDAIFLGVDAPVRMSGDIKGSAPITVIGPKGIIQMKEGCIRAMRHIHMNPQEADYFGLKEGDLISIRVGGLTSVTFDNVVVRIKEGLLLQLHLDTDEANVADINCNQDIEIIKKIKTRT